MSSRDSLVVRVRGEFREMPGLSLTFPQACRLWQIDPVECRAVLQALLDERFLRVSESGAFVVVSHSDPRAEATPRSGLPKLRSA
jgi:hypothetical protein